MKTPLFQVRWKGQLIGKDIWQDRPDHVATHLLIGPTGRVFWYSHAGLEEITHECELIVTAEAALENDAEKRARSSFVRMFQPRFAALVEAGTKRQTVRPVPVRMPQPGDRLSLRAWSGAPYRSPQRTLREAIVASVREIEVSADGVELEGVRLAPEAAAEFARADGFADLPELVAWFAAEHALPFRGIVIAWENIKGRHAED